MTAGTYAGDLTPTQAWEILAGHENSVLVDVRTQAEWQFVGLPDLTDIGKQVILNEWVVFPGGGKNETFMASLMEAVPDPETEILFICRSGGRSMAAAATATAINYSRCYNVLEGFEGDRDENGHRGKLGGWKACGLPWVQS